MFHIRAVINGTFYNRDELDGLWPSDPPPANDAERLVAGVLAVGFENALQRINGDFAVAAYDERADILWLARDRFGVKPLYYTSTPDRLAFCSRPGPLLALPGVSPAVNRRFVAVFAGAHYRYIDNRSEESPFEAVRQVPARSWVRWQNGALTTGRYWDLADVPDLELPEAELAARYRELLLDAVRRRVVVADRPAFTLSGGLDSSSVLSCAVEALGRPQHAYSTVYTDRTYDESEEIRSMLATKVVEWHPVTVGSPDVLALVERMVAEHDEPVATATWLSHDLLCEHVARDGFRTLFGGLGGDELNAGEYEYFFFHFADLKTAGASAFVHEIERWAAHHDHPIYRKNRAVAEAALGRIADLAIPGRCRPDRARLERYYAAVNPDYYDLRTFEPVLDHPFTSYLKNRTYQDLFRETTPCCLRAEDRQTGAHHLEHMDPFFDHRLAELMFRVPGTMKIRDGVTKRLLREAMAGILPEETRTRVKKTGWNAPAHAWFSQGRAAEQLGDLITSRAFRERSVYRVDEVARLFAEHRRIVSSGAAAENHMMFFWQLVNLEIWLARCMPKASGGAR